MLCPKVVIYTTTKHCGRSWNASILMILEHATEFKLLLQAWWIHRLCRELASPLTNHRICQRGSNNTLVKDRMSWSVLTSHARRESGSGQPEFAETGEKWKPTGQKLVNWLRPGDALWWHVWVNTGMQRILTYHRRYSMSFPSERFHVNFSWSFSVTRIM